MVTFGNLTIVEGPDSVELRQKTVTGSAIYTYREIPLLIEILSRLKKPAGADDEDDYSDLI